ncbi:MAG: YbaK/EbsC family protein [Clostridiales bacterium]|nr:YbaK/EbsC family protein [Eubacteriales bacterium]MDH7566034.1 YbaK/EbsC family protein [Clostridiales bacterium]
MSTENVRKYFEDKNINVKIIEFAVSTATVDLAAAALGVEPARIAKTMAFGLKEKNILIVSTGDARVDNQKYKALFGQKAKMLKPDQVLEATGHPVGGVCPFGLKTDMEIYLDVSLKRYATVYPAAGSQNSAVEMTPQQLEEITGGTWVDVCGSEPAE